MSWSSIVATEEVSFEDAATSPFPKLHTLPIGAGAVECMSKSDVLYYLDVNSAALSSYTDVELVQKKDFCVTAFWTFVPDGASADYFSISKNTASAGWVTVAAGYSSGGVQTGSFPLPANTSLNATLSHVSGVTTIRNAKAVTYADETLIVEDSSLINSVAAAFTISGYFESLMLALTVSPATFTLYWSFTAGTLSTDRFYIYINSNAIVDVDYAYSDSFQVNHGDVILAVLAHQSGDSTERMIVLQSAIVGQIDVQSTSNQGINAELGATYNAAWGDITLDGLINEY